MKKLSESLLDLAARVKRVEDAVVRAELARADADLIAAKG